MKKSFIVLLVVLAVSLLTCSAIADDFHTVTIGEKKIELGMTKTKVAELTGASSIKTNSDWDFGVWYVLVDDNGYNENASNQIPGNFLLSSRSTFAGFPDCNILYSFDKDDILDSIVIIFDASEYGSFSSNSQSKADEKFDKLSTALNKYGAPTFTNQYWTLKGTSFDASSAIKERAFTKRSSGLNWYQDYQTNITGANEWFVEQKDNYIDIKLLEFDRTSTYVTHDFIKEKRILHENCVIK